MSCTTESKDDRTVDSVIMDATRELERLRLELEKYKVFFDSARLIVGHEFIKPLTSISGYVELLKGNLAPVMAERERRYFEKIQEAITRLEDLVDAFVMMLRFDTKVEHIHDLEKVDLDQLTRKITGRFSDGDCPIEVEIADEVGTVMLRRKSIEVVLENLISNAIKHSNNDRPIRIYATVFNERRGTSGKRLLKVSVEDHGAGIPEDEIEQIFNPFYRVGGKEEIPGMGLGLALVKSIITILKGEIFVRSKPGEGTTVTFIVPIEEGAVIALDRIG